MAKRVRIELDHKGISKLLNSEPVRADLQRRAERIAAAAGPGFEVESWKGFDRAHATVRSATPAARRAEAEHRALTRALDAGRG